MMNTHLKDNIGTDIIRDVRYPTWFGFGFYKKISTDEIFIAAFHRLAHVHTEEEFMSIAVKLNI